MANSNAMAILLSTSLVIGTCAIGANIVELKLRYQKYQVTKLVIPATPIETITAPVIKTKHQPKKSGVYGEDIHTYVEEYFEIFDLPKGLARAMIRIESDTGRHMVSKSGCLGWWQFCSAMRNHYKLGDPMNLQESTRAASELNVDNTKSLKILKIKPTKQNLYMAYNIGPGNLKTAIRLINGHATTKERRSAMMKAINTNWHVSVMGIKPKSAKAQAKGYYAYFYDRVTTLAINN